MALATLAGALVLAMPVASSAQVNFTSSNGYQVAVSDSTLNGGYPRFGTPSTSATGSGSNTNFFKPSVLCAVGNYQLGFACLTLMYDTSAGGTYTGAVNGSLAEAIEPVFRIHVKATTPPGVTASGSVIVPVYLHWIQQIGSSAYVSNTSTSGLFATSNPSNNAVNPVTLFNYNATYLLPLVSLSGIVGYLEQGAYSNETDYTDISLRNEAINVSIPATSSTTYEGDSPEFYIPYSGAMAVYGMGETPGGSSNVAWGTVFNYIGPEGTGVGYVH